MTEPTETSVARPTRRTVLYSAAGVAALAVAGGGYYAWLVRMPFEGDTLAPPVAMELAQSGDILLVDVRRPDEWAATGIGAGAEPLDMRRTDFIERLTELVGGDKVKPVAVMCARGVRSNQISQRLADAGFTNIIDVPEGMLGSRAGPGWLERGLPVRQP